MMPHPLMLDGRRRHQFPKRIAASFALADIEELLTIDSRLVGGSVARKIFKRMSLLQIVTMQVFLIIMLSLPLKIIARLLFRIKYIWVTPWFNV